MSTPGHIDYLSNDLRYMLRFEKEERSPYIYVQRTIDQLFYNLHTCNSDTDKNILSYLLSNE